MLLDYPVTWIVAYLIIGVFYTYMIADWYWNVRSWREFKEDFPQGWPAYVLHVVGWPLVGIFVWVHALILYILKALRRRKRERAFRQFIRERLVHGPTDGPFSASRH